MGIFDKAREALHEHGDRVDPVVDGAADGADRRTGGAHGQQIDWAAELAKDGLGEQAPGDTSSEPGQPG